MTPNSSLHIVTSLARNAGHNIKASDFKVKVFETKQAAEKWFEANKAYVEWAEFSEITELLHEDGSFVRYIAKYLELDYVQGLWIRKS